MAAGTVFNEVVIWAVADSAAGLTGQGAMEAKGTKSQEVKVVEVARGLEAEGPWKTGGRGGRARVMHRLTGHDVRSFVCG